MAITYSTGTVSLTNGSATVTGSGTSWVNNAFPGHLLWVNGAFVGVVQEVVSATELTLVRDFVGSNTSGADYDLISTGAIKMSLADDINELLSDIRAVQDGALSGRFGDGDAAEPGIAFLNEIGLGFYRKAAGLIAVTGGLEVPSLSGTAVTQSKEDVTEGRLLKVGDLGIGGIGPNCDDCNDPIWGITQRVTVATINKPDPSNIAGELTSHSWGGGDAAGTQILHVFFPAPSKGKLFVRVKENDTWQPWWEVYHSGSLVGTVSQSGGFPTGAAFETDENANGKYWLRADGLLICQHTLSSSNSAAVTWTYPADFDATPAVIPSVLGLSARSHTISSRGTTSVDISVWDDAGSRQSNSCDIIAIGKAAI